MKKILHEENIKRIETVPNFARACGRVYIGGHSGKRPNSRLCVMDISGSTGKGI